MIGSPFRSWSRRLIEMAIGAFVATVVLSLICTLLRPLFPVFVAFGGLATVIGLILRWRLFQWRGW
jgi:hypothetical protein